MAASCKNSMKLNANAHNLPSRLLRRLARQPFDPNGGKSEPPTSRLFSVLLSFVSLSQFISLNWEFPQNTGRALKSFLLFATNKTELCHQQSGMVRSFWPCFVVSKPLFPLFFNFLHFFSTFFLALCGGKAKNKSTFVNQSFFFYV